VYQRLHAVLLGKASDARYERLTLQDRRNILRTLQQTKKGMPSYLQTAVL
jgi:hypothetical protein